MLARRSCCEQVTITSQEVHGIDLEAFPAYKDRLIEYLERFIGDLVVARGRIATLLVRPGCWRWPPTGTWPTGWFVAPADDRACTSPPCMSVAIRIARTSRSIDRLMFGGATFEAALRVVVEVTHRDGRRNRPPGPRVDRAVDVNTTRGFQAVVARQRESARPAYPLRPAFLRRC